MDRNKKEIRTINISPSVMEAENGESRKITGTAIVFNAESRVMMEDGMMFREIILPEAAANEWLATQDIKLNMLHERNLTIARWNKGEGSLRLWADEEGVKFETEAPKCDIGDRCLELIRRGDYSGCSFEFWPQDYDIREEEDEALIVHRSFAAIGALTIGMDPAYTQTSVSARELKSHEEVDEEKTKKEDECAAVMKMRRLRVQTMTENYF